VPGRLAATKPAAELIGYGQRDRRLVIVLTDGIGDAWHPGMVQRLLTGWGRRVPLVIVHLLARRQWRRTRIVTRPARLSATGPAVANHQYRMRDPVMPNGGGLITDGPTRRGERDRAHLFVPVIELEHDQLAGSARLVPSCAAAGTAR
jgi:hypothetical protein